MKRLASRAMLLAFLVGSLLSFLAYPVGRGTDEINNETIVPLVVRLNSGGPHIQVPFRYQDTGYYCGPAALEMVFDYYGEDVPQREIADVARTFPYTTFADELRRAAHFSNQSVSLGKEMLDNISGYSARRVGYAAFEHWGLTVDELKILIDEGRPLVVLMWGTPSKTYGHYRVIVGYNESHVIMHDPWNKNLWGGIYGGANTSMPFSTFLDLWSYSGNWGLLVCPWKTNVEVLGRDAEDNLTIAANVTYPCIAPFSGYQYSAHSCNATISLPEGLELASGETFKHSLGDIAASDSVQTSWTVHVAKTGLYNVSLTVSGTVNGSVGAHGTYSSYTYEDVIGGSSNASFSATEHPVALFEYSTSKPHAGEVVTLNASASSSPHGSITTYEWSFGDGESTAVTEPIAQHTYSTPREYNITLKVTDNNTMCDVHSHVIFVLYRSDLNRDRSINIQDVTIAAVAYGSNLGDSKWNQMADLDSNDTINIIDVSLVARDYGKVI